MLVLSRKVGERIHIGADIVLTVTALDNHKVRIGIEAPQSVSIWREELAPARFGETRELPSLVVG